MPNGVVRCLDVEGYNLYLLSVAKSLNDVISKAATCPKNLSTSSETELVKGQEAPRLQASHDSPIHDILQ